MNAIALLRMTSACLLSAQFVCVSSLKSEEAAVCGLGPHGETQRLLAEFFRAPPDVDEARHRRTFDQLVKLAREDGPRFVQQGILAEIKHNYGGDLGTYWLFAQAGIPEVHYAVGLAPLLYCEDSRLQKEARRLFPRAIGCGCIDGQPDLSHIQDHVTGSYQKPTIAEPLKRAVFEQSPSAAFFLFLQPERDQWISYRRKERFISNALYEKKWLGGIPGEKVNAETAAALRELGESKFWWSRMFAAEIMVQNKEFRDPELIKRLLEDENKLVRQSVASIEKPDPLRFAKVAP